MYKCRTGGSPYLPCQDYNLRSHRGKKKIIIIDKQAQQMLKARGVVEGSHSLPYSVWRCQRSPASGGKEMRGETQSSPHGSVRPSLSIATSFHPALLTRGAVLDASVPTVEDKEDSTAGLKLNALLSFFTQLTWQVQLRAFKRTSVWKAGYPYFFLPNLCFSPSSSRPKQQEERQWHEKLCATAKTCHLGSLHSKSRV